MNELKTNYVEPAKQASSTPQSKKEIVKHEGKELPPEVVEVATISQANKQEHKDHEEVPASNQQVLEAVAKLKDYVQSIERDLDFELDEESGITIIRVFDASTSELIRQMPGEAAVSLAQKLNQEEPLTLFSAQV
jgi:flagellar protein FlaG